MAKLTDKEEGFVQGLLKGLSQREAYKGSYNTSRMKNETIDNKACLLFKKNEVRVRYEELHDKMIDKAEQEGLMNATELLRKLNELILRNEKTDDRTALEGIKTLGKNMKLFTDKVEHSGEINIPQTNIKRGK